MQWRKSPEILIATFQEVLPDHPAAERRSMFGYPCCFVNGNMFTGLHQENMVLRLPAEDRARLLSMEGSRTFEPMAGRPMREYVVVPASLLRDPAELRVWVGRSFTYASSLPPKTTKAATPKRTAAAKRTTGRSAGPGSGEKARAAKKATAKRSGHAVSGAGKAKTAKKGAGAKRARRA